MSQPPPPPPPPPSPAPWTLVYDGQCRFCVACVALLRRWDQAGRLTAVPFQDGAAVGRLPTALPRADLQAAMHLVRGDGAVFAGARAAPPLLRLLPGGTLLAALFILPGVPGAAAAVYRWVARHRHRLGCGSPVCRRGAS